MSLIDRVNKVRLESSKFRKACAKSMTKSKILVAVSSRLIDENQEQLEQSMILKEEMIANKCENLSIMEYVRKDKKLNNIHPLYYKELRIIEERLAELDKFSISDENKSLQELRKQFLTLSFLPDPR
jgi:hypothetical protein